MIVFGILDCWYIPAMFLYGDERLMCGVLEGHSA